MISRLIAEAEAPARVAETRGEDRQSDAAPLGAEIGTATSERTKSESHELMERVVERSNLRLAYQRVVENKGDGWVRRRLRCLLWRQWKRGRTRARKLRALGLADARARVSSGNGHGAWWNAGASHLHEALPIAFFTRMGLVSLLHECQRLQSVR